MIGRTKDDGERRMCPVRRACILCRAVETVALLFVLVMSPSLAHADVLVVRANQNAVHEEVLSSLRATLADRSGNHLKLRVISVTEFSQSGPRAADSELPSLIITLGTDAAAAVLQKNIPTPTYCTFLPKAAYTLLANSSNEMLARRSALYLDQPFTRQMQLIRLALPTRVRVGAILGPESRKSEHDLRQAAVSAGLVLRVEQITDEKQLVGALHRTMDGADVLLAVPDPLVFNRNTAQSVLLTTYRLGKPVAGYSRAYVSAGALLSVYSTPAQIGRQIGEELLAMQDRPGRPLPAPGYPRYFSVEINERVARSLGIEPDQVEDLTRRLAEKTTGTSHE